MFSEADIDSMLEAFGGCVRVGGRTFPATVVDETDEHTVGRVRITASSPVIMVKDRAMFDGRGPAIAVDQVVTVNGKRHIAKALKPDGEGFLEVRLIDA